MQLESDSRGVHEIALFIYLISGCSPEDTYLRHAARISLRNVLINPEIQHLIIWLLKEHVTDVRKEIAVLDDVFLGVPTAYAGWWLSERLKAGKVDPQLAERAAQHVGRNGCDCHRQVVWTTAEDINKLKTQLEMMQALKKGIETSGASFKPALTGRLVDKIRAGLHSSDDNTVLGSIQLASLISFEVVNSPNPFKENPEVFNVFKVAYDLVWNTKRSEAVRNAAFGIVEQLPKEHVLSVSREIFADNASPQSLRDKAIAHMMTSTKLNDQIAIKDLLKSAPYRQCVTIANGLAGSKSGADLLFADVKAGKASARLLQEKTVLERLKTTNAANWEATVKELTAGIPSADARLAALIKERGDGYRKSKHDIEAGKKVFTTTCANCHQVGGQGAKVGPQLDGIGNRGVERLLEDTLDPNRNVDHAFHTTILDLKDGGQLTGLLRVEGNVLIVVDSQAKEKRVSVDDVDKKRTSPVSPMPSDIAEKLKPKDFYDLIAYLADLRAK